MSLRGREIFDNMGRKNSLYADPTPPSGGIFIASSIKMFGQFLILPGLVLLGEGEHLQNSHEHDNEASTFDGFNIESKFGESVVLAG